jgi:uracil phosphoribosyltransferase
MQVHVADHPLISHKMTVLRDKRTDSPTFRRLADELVTLLAYEATRDVRVEEVQVMTPVAEATGVRLSDPPPLVVPILRAGLGMLEGMQRLLPTAEVGFLGMVRNEETLEAVTYAERLPDDLTGRQCYVLDPMLATGGTLAAAIDFLVKRGADHITAITLLAAPEGITRPGHARHGGPRRATQRAGLHRPGPGRRRRQAVRRRGLRAPCDGSGGAAKPPAVSRPRKLSH